MADETKEIKGLMKQRTNLVGGLLSVLERKVAESERVLLRQVVEGFVDKLEQTPDGKVKNTLFNKRLLSNIDTIFDRFGKSEGLEIAKTIATGVQSVINFSGEYYRTFTTKAKLLTIKPQVMETMGAWLGLTDTGKLEPNGYLNKLIKDTTVNNQVKNMTLRAVVGQQGWKETKQQLGEFIQGNSDKAGAMSRYYRNFVYDTYSQVDRATTQIYANKLGFKFFIYEGGLIESSRTFCIERNGKVFHESEIQKFDPPVAKPPNYNPFTDCGGYGCRHHLNGIPDALAYTLRPEAKTLFGGGAAPAPAQPAAQPAKQVPASQPAKQVEAPKPAAKPKAAPAPVANKLDAIVDRKTAKGYIENIVKDFKVNGVSPKVSISTALSTEQLKAYAKQVGKLFSEYFINSTEIMEVKFKSTGRSFGFVAPFSSGKIKTLNFGDRVDKSRATKWEDAAQRLSRQGKSRVDEDNLQVSTATHEFAHTIGIRQVANVHVKNFFNELAPIRKQYHEEINGLVRDGKIKEAGNLFLGRYASENIDEFWAEAFTEYKLSRTPSKYAKLVGQLAEKYFKK